MPSTGEGEVRIRAAALVVCDDRILLARHMNAGRSYYLLPGGGAEAGEFARDALARELHEEAGAEFTLGDVRYVVETRAPDGSRHLVQLVFKAQLRSPLGASRDPRVSACDWHPISDLRTLQIYPDMGTAIADDLERGVAGLRYIWAPWQP